MRKHNFSGRLTALFIDYIYSPEGAEIIADCGYIPIPKK